MTSPLIWLIVGLGNPGGQYTQTRHNAGFILLDKLAVTLNAVFKSEARFFGELSSSQLAGNKVLLLKPMTYMNLSGKSIRAVSQYYKIDVTNILVVHDEIDLEAGDVRLKSGGGHGGHNGLRSIITELGGSKDFLRLRLGVGHPGTKEQVVDYVLSKPSATELSQISDAIDESVKAIPEIIQGKIDSAMQNLNSYYKQH